MGPICRTRLWFRLIRFFLASWELPGNMQLWTHTRVTPHLPRLRYGVSTIPPFAAAVALTHNLFDLVHPLQHLSQPSPHS